MSNNKKQQNVILGGIIKHNGGTGFKITCETSKEANRIKDMLRWILVNEQHRSVFYNTGYYDSFDEKGDKR